jgi:hypothetical protein
LPEIQDFRPSKKLPANARRELKVTPGIFARSNFPGQIRRIIQDIARE